MNKIKTRDEVNTNNSVQWRCLSVNKLNRLIGTHVLTYLLIYLLTSLLTSRHVTRISWRMSPVVQVSKKNVVCTILTRGVSVDTSRYAPLLMVTSLNDLQRRLVQNALSRIYYNYCCCSLPAFRPHTSLSFSLSLSHSLSNDGRT